MLYALNSALIMDSRHDRLLRESSRRDLAVAIRDLTFQGMFDIGRLKDGDHVVVSGAAGSVGLVRPPAIQIVP
jgi:hypothetical protein